MMSALTNAYAKEISALKLKKYRQSYGKFIVEGPNLIEEALNQDKFELESIIGTDSFFDTLSTQIPDKIDIISVNERELKKISALKTPYQAIAVLKMADTSPKISEPLLFYVDGIQDPGNMGTIIRSADWFGIGQLLLGNGTVDLFNPKCIQASMGSIFRVDGIECPLDKLEALRQEYDIIGADSSGQSLDEVDTGKKTIVVIGSEGSGIKPETSKLLKGKVAIPSFGNNKAESLNAAISASILMYAFKIKKAGRS